jgi:hypothetical protein
VGVMFFQMLYGKRPYGEGKTQEEVLRGDIIVNARPPQFPAKPTVSSAAKEFITKYGPAACCARRGCDGGGECCSALLRSR